MIQANIAFRLLFLLFLGAMAVSCGETVRPEPVLDSGAVGFRAKMLPVIRKAMAEKGIVGMSLAVYSGGKPIWQEGFGYENRGKGLRATENTRFNIASVSKVFTAIAVMQLEEKGLLNLDTPVSNYLPEFSVKSWFTPSRAVTVRMLLSHQSGLPNDLIQNVNPDEAFEYRKIAGSVASNYLQSDPGSVFQYCNEGYGILTLLVERLTGLNFSDYIDRNILKPCGMEDSTYSSKELTNRVSLAYLGSSEQPPSGVWLPGAGGLFSTSADMSRFIGMLCSGGVALSNRILRAETLERMFSPETVKSPLNMGHAFYGLGFSLEDPARVGVLRYGRRVGHSGGWLAYSSQLAIMPDLDMGVFVIVNTASGSQFPLELSDKLLAELIKEKGIPALTNRLAPLEPAVGIVRAEVTTPSVFDTSDGIYYIRSDSNGMKLRVANGKNDKFYRMVAITNGDFKLYSSVGNTLEYYRLGFFRYNKVLYVAKYVNNGYSIVGKEAKDSPVTDAYRKRLGKYHALNVNSADPMLMEGELTERNGRLFLTIQIFGQAITFPIEIIDNEKFMISGASGQDLVGRSAGTVGFLREEDGRVVLMSKGVKLVNY